MGSSKAASAVYVGAHALQVALLGAAWYVQVLTTEKMMVMRYFFAKNLVMEGHVFSPVGRIAQAGALAVVACVAVAAAVRWLARRRREQALRAGGAAVLAASGAGMLLLMSAEQTRGLYVLVLAVWLSLLVQMAVVFVSARGARRSSGRAAREPRA